MVESVPLLLALDQGTTSSRAMLFQADGEILATQQRELPLIFPQSGWVEQDPETIWRDTVATARQAIAQRADALQRIAAIGITNQRETTVIWDRATGAPIYNAIVWQDRRTADVCAQFKADGHESHIQHKTGLLLDPYFCATKIAWILDHVDGARARAMAGQLAFGTIDSFLLWRLTDGRVHATDASNASRTLLFDIHRQCWDEELLELFGIPASLLPAVRDNVAAFGDTPADLLGRALPIAAMAGDQHAAMVGQACFEPGTVKSTYGTGCFLLMNTGDRATVSHQRLLTTTAYRIDGQTTYAIEGSIFIAGAAIQWLRDGLQLIGEAAETEALAQSVDSALGVYFVPALTGLGAPYWNAEARGALIGIGRDTQNAHIVRAALEAQAYQTRDLLEAMRIDVGQAPALIRADGGLVANQFVCQRLADLLQTPIDVPRIGEATAWGAASLAGLGVGVFDDLEQIAAVWQRRQRYLPMIQAQQADEAYGGWRRAVQAVLTAAQPLV